MAGEGLHKPKRHPEAANTAKDLGCDATDSWSRWLLVRSSFAAPRLILIAFHRSHGSRRNGVNLRQERPSPGLRPPSPRWRGARGALHESAYTAATYNRASFSPPRGEKVPKADEGCLSQRHCG